MISFYNFYVEPSGLSSIAAPILINHLGFTVSPLAATHAIFSVLLTQFAQVDFVTSASQPDSGFLGPFCNCVLLAPVPFRLRYAGPRAPLDSLLIVGSGPLFMLPI